MHVMSMGGRNCPLPVLNVRNQEWSASSRVVCSDHEVQFVSAKIRVSGSEEIKPYFTNFIKEPPEDNCTSVEREPGGYAATRTKHTKRLTMYIE